MDKAIAGNLAHPDCNLAAARLKRAIENHSKHNAFNLLIEVDVRVNRTQDEQERELQFEKTAVSFVEDAIRNAKMTVEHENKLATNDEVVKMKDRKLVSRVEVDNVKKDNIKTKSGLDKEKAIVITARKIVRKAILAAKAQAQAEDLEMERAYSAAAHWLVANAITKATAKVVAETERERGLAFTAKQLVADAIFSAKEIVAIEIEQTEKLLEKEGVSQSELTDSSQSSYEELIGATAKEEIELNYETPSEAVKEVLSIFLCKMQEAANSKCSPDASETDMAQTREEIEMLWPIISALSSHENVKDGLSDEKAVRSEERNSKAAETAQRFGEDATTVYDEEKSKLETGGLHQAQRPAAEEALEEDAGDFLQTMTALSGYLFTQNRSEAELQEAEKELGMLWPLLVEMRDNLASNDSAIREDR